MTTKLPTGTEWDVSTLQAYDDAIATIAKAYRLETFPIQLEIISSEQMIDAYSTIGMPLAYHHWSFGKQFVNVEKFYRRGLMGLAYEIVINANPCVAYLLEENSLVMQATIIAHACYGHNAFFKNNYLFKAWTNPDAIIDYLLFAKNYIAECERKYGMNEVEELLDACHTIMNYGVDRYRRPQKLTLQEEKARQKAREAYLQSQVNELWRTIPDNPNKTKFTTTDEQFPKEPEENLLYFIEKNAPRLEPWQREIVRIVRKIAQYFYPQRQTKLMNEGWATFWHYTIINTLYEQEQVDDTFMFEFMHNHTNLMNQLPFDDPNCQGLNPYTLGFNIFNDIKRICTAPTDEDKHWFPELAGSDWVDAIHFAMENYKDDSFVGQYLSPKVIRDMKLFVLLDDDKQEDLIVEAIHDDQGYQTIRDTLAKTYNLNYSEPDIQVSRVNVHSDRALTLTHQQYDRRPLDESDCHEVLQHIHTLWQFPVHLETIDESNKLVSTVSFPRQSDEESNNTS